MVVGDEPMTAGFFLYYSRGRTIMKKTEVRMDYMTLKEASILWGVTPRRINYYCSAGRIPGAVKMGTVWLIPKDAQKPSDRRKKTMKQSKGDLS